MVLTIHDIYGRQVITLVDGSGNAGRHAVIWKGVNAAGMPVSSGIYFVKLEAGEYRQVRKLSLVR